MIIGLISMFAVMYIVGCVLSYGRAMAMLYALFEKYSNNFPKLEKEEREFILYMTLFSWVGLIAMGRTFLEQKHPDEPYLWKYDYKWSLKELRSKYNQRVQQTVEKELQKEFEDILKHLN